MSHSGRVAGGKARARALTKAERVAQASKAAQARWSVPRKPRAAKKKARTPRAAVALFDTPDAPDGFVMPTAPEAIRPRTRDEFMTEFAALARCIDNVLVAHDGLRHALKQPHPPWDAPMDVALKRYGPGPVFSLWCECRAVEALRIAWTGKGTPE